VLFLLFTAVPLIEIALFVIVGERLGLGPTIAIVILTAFAGATLVSRQGRAQLERFRQTVQRGELPTRELAHGGMILVSGALLITPGFLTDVVGFLLLVPAVREALRLWWVRRRSNRVEIL
jgi:UPF0716 protein FxsA